MRILAALAATAGLGFAASASADPAHLDDVQFVQANRCLGLMSSKALATPDAAALKRLIDSQAGGRAAFVYDKADDARETAMRQAEHAKPDALAKLAAERDGACHAFVAATTTASGAASGRRS